MHVDNQLFNLYVTVFKKLAFDKTLYKIYFFTLCHNKRIEQSKNKQKKSKSFLKDSVVISLYLSEVPTLTFTCLYFYFGTNWDYLYHSFRLILNLYSFYRFVSEYILSVLTLLRQSDRHCMFTVKTLLSDMS